MIVREKVCLSLKSSVGLVQFGICCNEIDATVKFLAMKQVLPILTLHFNQNSISRIFTQNLKGSKERFASFEWLRWPWSDLHGRKIWFLWFCTPANQLQPSLYNTHVQFCGQSVENKNLCFQKWMQLVLVGRGVGIIGGAQLRPPAVRHSHQSV